MSIRESVFIVDDDPSTRASVNRQLRAHGFVATLLASASALLEQS